MNGLQRWLLESGQMTAEEEEFLEYIEGAFVSTGYADVSRSDSKTLEAMKQFGMLHSENKT